MSTEAGDAEDWRQPAPGCGTERAVFGGLAGLTAGYPAQGVIAVAWRTPVGTSPLGVVALAVLVFGGALAGPLWPRRWRHARGTRINLHQ